MKRRMRFSNTLRRAENHLPLPTAFALWFNGHLSATTATTDRNAIGRAFVKLTKNVHSNACESTQSCDTAEDCREQGQRAGEPRRACRAVHFKDSVAALDGIAQQQLATGGRTLLIWMGSGWPVAIEHRARTPRAEATRGLHHEFVEVLHDLRAAQVTVYSIAPGDGLPQGQGQTTMGRR